MSSSFHSKNQTEGEKKLEVDLSWENKQACIKYHNKSVGFWNYRQLTDLNQSNDTEAKYEQMLNEPTFWTRITWINQVGFKLQASRSRETHSHRANLPSGLGVGGRAEH